jgi:hypothetical protein
MSPFVATGRQLAVSFLVLCSTLSAVNAVKYLLTMTKLGILAALASGVFILFTGTAAWQIFQWNPTGRFFGFFVVLQWFGALINVRNVGTLTYILSIPMAAFGIWLLLPPVKQEFQRRKAIV